MTSPDRITVSRSKRGTTIKATGRSAQALFDALAKPLERAGRPADAQASVEAVARAVSEQVAADDGKTTPP